MLCTVTVQIDMPDLATKTQVETWVAFAVSQYFTKQPLAGMTGNCAVTLTAQQSGATVGNPTIGVAVPLTLP